MSNRFLIQTYLMAAVFNYWTDHSEDPVSKKITRAALNAIPMSLVVDTTGVVNELAKKFDVEDIHQPASTFSSIRDVVTGVAQQMSKKDEKPLQVVAFHEKDTYKDL